MKPGIYKDIPNEDYHACKEAVSNSGLGDILQSPFHYWSRHLDPARPAQKEKAGQLEGTLAHCAILEPGEFLSRYAVGPDVTRSTNIWKDFAADLAPGVVGLRPDQYEVAMRQAESVRRLPDVAEILARGESELSVFWEDPETGVLCRCRPDWTHTAGSGAIIMDVKTYSDASPSEFARQVARKGYHRQDAMYSEGFKIASSRPVLAFLFLAVEDKWPFAASVTMLDDDSKAAGQDQYRRTLATYAECRRANHWPGYSSGIELISLPRWALAA